ELHDKIGVDFTGYKQSTIIRRIRRRIAIVKADTAAEYLKIIRNNDTELNKLYRDFLINVTCFFRDAEIFEALAQTCFDDIVRNKGPDRPIRVWVPGCSTGEEVYTLAILLWEHLGDQAPYIPLQLFGTDLSED